MVRLTVIVLLCLGPISTYGQEKGLDLDNSVVGFACGIGGRQSEPVQKLERLLVARNYAHIRALLISGNNAEKFLALVICEHLHEKGLISLFGVYYGKYQELKQSDLNLRFCNGCTHHAKYTFKEIMDNEKNSDLMRTREWVRNNIRLP